MYTHPLVFTKVEVTEFREQNNFIGLKFHEGRGLARDPETGLMYHINRSGQPAYQARYYRAHNYREGVATVEITPNKWCHIGFDGKPLYLNRYDEVGDSHCGLAWARQRGQYLFIDPRSGKPAHGQITWKQASDMLDGYAEVETNSGSLSILIIDAAGEVVDEIRPRQRRKNQH